MDLLKYIRNVPDWPQKGIQFKDITTLCKHPEAFKESCDRIIKKYKNKNISKVVAIEARGYVFGGVVAYHIGAGFILIRKPGKLPSTIIDCRGEDPIILREGPISLDEIHMALE